MLTFLLWVVGVSLIFAAFGEAVDRYLARREQKVTVRLSLDTRQFERSMRDAQRAIQAFGTTIAQIVHEAQASIPAVREMTRAILSLGRSEEIKILAYQMQYGPWNRTSAGVWQSDLCAAWVHESCPLADHCDCRCHR